MSLNGDLNLSVESKYGHGELIKDENYHILNYGKIPNDNTQRKLEYQILSDPTLIVNFATVSEGNLTSTDPNIYASTFHQDPINQIAIKYKSNSDYFNVRIYEDTDNKEIVYYPVYGEGNNVVELSDDIMRRIENNEIPLVSEAFMIIYLIQILIHLYRHMVMMQQNGLFIMKLQLHIIMFQIQDYQKVMEKLMQQSQLKVLLI